MNLKTITLENGWTAVVADKPSVTNSTGASGFASQLNRAAEAAKQSGTSNGTSLQDACSRLSANSKAVLERMKAGVSDITQEEWSSLRRELKEAGLITQGEFAASDPNVVTVGYMDANGGMVSYPFATGCSISSYGNTNSMKSTSFWDPDWNGDPFQYLDQCLKLVRNQRDNLDLLALAGGPGYDTSHLTRQIEAQEKVANLVKALLELC